MSSIGVYIDTNCINARQKDDSLNELEKLHEVGKIQIEKTSVLDTELQEGKGYPLGLNKSDRYIESYEVAVLDHSRLGHSVVGGNNDEKMFSRILEILWGKKHRTRYSKSEIRDAMHLFTAIRYGGSYFITLERDLLIKAELLQKEFGIKTRSPKDCLKEVKERLSLLESLGKI